MFLPKNSKTMIIGITGGIGSGKSTFSDLLINKGYSVYNTDAKARELQNVDAEIRQKIIALFGNDSYDTQGLNRPFIAQIVFNDSSKLKQLNEIVHPAVKLDFVNWAKQFDLNQNIFLECAILFEGGFHKLVDKSVLITASELVRIQRVMKRDKVTELQVRARMKNQMSEEDKKKLADFVIYSDDEKPMSEKLNKFLLELD